VIPGEWPQESFDLIVLSEILYYFDDTDLEQVLGLAVKTLNPGGHLLAVHWQRRAPDHPRAGDEIHQILAGDTRLARLARYRDPDFTAEVYTHANGDLRSVAQAGGIV
jgi:SAM-dependent methyltransferase